MCLESPSHMSGAQRRQTQGLLGLLSPCPTKGPYPSSCQVSAPHHAAIAEGSLRGQRNSELTAVTGLHSQSRPGPRKARVTSTSTVL
jgi:hypothetical protein